MKRLYAVIDKHGNLFDVWHDNAVLQRTLTAARERAREADAMQPAGRPHTWVTFVPKEPTK